MNRLININLKMIVALLLTAGMSGGVIAETSSIPKAHEAFFKDKVKPLLENSCFKCHASKKQRGKLRLDSLAFIQAGGESGERLIVPHRPEQSLLYKSVTYEDPDLQMPEKGKLSDEKIAIIRKWIEIGAPWPGAKKDNSKIVIAQKGISDEDRAWWSYQLVVDPKVPQVDDKGWAVNPIDLFVMQKLKEIGLSPSKRAEKIVIVRRLYQTLHGLPPTPEQVETFINDKSPDAYERLIDRLLASPRYGEHWGRHWLDLVRYAESDGYRGDFYRPNAWRYRDYVIQSFNSDKPYAQFIKEQLAGDEIDPKKPENLVATGYLRHGIYEWNQRDALTQWDNVLSEMVDVTGETFLGMSMGCAHCHDHKFDPIQHKDYYAMRAFFAPVIWREDVPIATPQERKQWELKEKAWKAEHKELLDEIRAIEKPYKDNGVKKTLKMFVDEMREMYEKPPAERSAYEMQIADFIQRQITREQLNLKPKSGEVKKKYDELLKRLKEAEKTRPKAMPAGQIAMDVIGKEPPATIIPGDRKKKEISPGFPEVLDTSEPKISEPVNAKGSSGRRSALATWIADQNNPLTYRVMVNRVWQYHFGRGIVGSSSEFGHLGEKPTHPELLDWLTTRFIENGGQFKSLHKLILMSATYRQSALVESSKNALLKDPGNKYYWKMNTRRLHAEQIRDAMLVSSGEIDLKMYGASTSPAKPRRTVYTRVVRNARDPLLDAYDWPEGITPMAKRNTTTTPNQALLMINNQYTLSRAKLFAERLLKKHNRKLTEIVNAGYMYTFSRPASEVEIEMGVSFIESQMSALAAEADEKTKTLSAGEQEKLYRNKAIIDFAHSLFNANEFLYID